MSRNQPSFRTTSAPTVDVPPLLVTADEALLAELLPLAAAADVTPTIARDPLAALATWSRAPVVLVGPDLAEVVAEVGPEKRPRTYVVTVRNAPHELYRTALKLGADQVIDVGGSSGWIVDLLADLTERRTDRGRVIGVIGGSGGAGATTLACALGQWAARSGPSVVIDCDPQGPGLDRILGVERHEGFRWDALCQTTGRLSARALRDALPRCGDLGVLSWYVDGRVQTLQAFAVREALSAARRGHRVVVVDLPRSTDPLIDEIAARCDELLVATSASVVGVAGAARMRARFADHAAPGVVLRGEAFAAADVQRAVGLPVVAQMRDQRGLAEAVDLGLGPLRHARGPLARAVARILDDAAPVSTTAEEAAS
ncbi:MULTISPECIES: septum site-determining protein Ssd [unclassified Nocardioides]|uniref:septum site-determining protein Ssd n=1 Tax=unclassified Nocardioides TaxID=2615069 RepID=UPI000701324D|nr:septum site-determining protein Ssd [Nocardioides sp. Root614]KRA30082.1 septum site determining protein [Nocardioides sp. Root614]KRA87009.1 septum site determining protein [Nocardioides sp. Root682]